MKSLKVLNLDETAIYRTRVWLPFLSFKRCKQLVWASLPSTSVKLSLESCSLYDDAIPNDLCNLASLKSLNLSRNPIQFLPESIKALTKLDELLLTSCKELQMIPKIPILSTSIALFATISPLWSIIPCFYSFKRCVVFGCERLKEVQGIFKLEPIENFEAEAIKRLFNMDSIDGNQVKHLNSYGFLYGHQAGKSEVSIPVSCNSRNRFLLNSMIILSGNNDKTFEFLARLEIVNETKGTKWTYSKHFMGISETKNILYWMVCWIFRDDELEAGDHICVRVLSDLSVLEFGNQIVYDYKPYDKSNSLHQLPRRSTYSNYLFGIFVHLSSIAQRTLYRVQSLVES